jgi:hypothetical protein
MSVAALLVTLALTAALTVLATVVNEHNQESQLRLQAREAASLLTAILPDIETPLASAAEVAVLEGGRAGPFDAFVKAHTGLGGFFDSISLWKLTSAAPIDLTHAGTRPELAGSLARLQAALVEARKTGSLAVVNLLATARPRIGFAYSPGLESDFVVYAESSLPTDRKIALAEKQVGSTDPLSDLNYAVYLGNKTLPASLVVSSVTTLPIPGSKVTVVVPFGDSSLTLVASATGSLTGSLSSRLAENIAGVGIALALAAALVADGLVRRRRYAEDLAAENRRLYRQMHGVTQELQRALLPAQLPAVDGMDFAVQYITGAADVDVGGIGTTSCREARAASCSPSATSRGTACRQRR